MPVSDRVRIFDRLTLTGKEDGDYGSREYSYLGIWGTYRVHVGESVADDTKVYYVYKNGKLFLNLYPTKSARILGVCPSNSYSQL